jgi:hypothetical protein
MRRPCAWSGCAYWGRLCVWSGCAYWERCAHVGGRAHGRCCTPGAGAGLTHGQAPRVRARRCLLTCAVAAQPTTAEGRIVHCRRPAVTRAGDGARVSRPPIARHSRSPPTSSVVFLSYSDSNTALAGSTRIECRAVVNRVPCCCHMSAESCRKSTKMRLHRSLRASVASSPLSSCGRPGSMMRRSGGDAAQGAFIACIAVCTWSGFRSRPCTPPSWLPCWLAAPAAS